MCECAAPIDVKGTHPMSEQSRKQTFTIQAHDLAKQVQALIEEGNVRRIVIRQGTRIVADIPLTVGVVGALIVPWAAAIGALAALVSDCTIAIIHEGPDAAPS
jgi:hypothetical protein